MSTVEQKIRSATLAVGGILRRGVVALALLVLAVPAAQVLAAPTIDTYIGGGNGDGSDAGDASIDPRGMIAVGPGAAADLYIADGRNNRVRRVDGRTGLIETVAGSGAAGFSGDGGSAVNASMNLPLDVARDSAGNLYIADTKNNRIRKVTPSGQISTFAGNGNLSFGGDGGKSTDAALYNPYGVAVGPDGYVYIADLGNNRIRKVGPANCVPGALAAPLGTGCVITTVVGTGTWGLSGDGGPALLATMRNPADVSFDGDGNMLIADWSNHRIRKVTNGIISTIAGGSYIMNGSVGDGGPALQAVLRYPTQVSSDAAGNVYIADSQQRRIRKVLASNQFIYTIAGTGTQGSSGDGGSAVAADMYDTWGVAVATNGSFWGTQTADTPKSQNNRVRFVQDGIIFSVVGGGLGDGGAAYDTVVDPRGGVTVQRSGGIADLYFADGTNHAVRWVDGATATMHTIAGTGFGGYTGNGGPATLAQLNTPTDVAVDQSGNVYVADSANSVVRRIDTRGTITTVAGNGSRGFSGDGGPATNAQLYNPTGVTVDNNGRLYIADNSNYRVRMVSSAGIISTIAGTGGSGYSGDGGPATAAKLQNPFDVAVTSSGIIYIADTWNHRIRRIDGNGTITTLAGTGYPGFSGDGQSAFSAQLNAPTLLSLDQSGTLYIADSYNHRIRSIATSGVITTVAGTGVEGVSGDGGPAIAATFSEPTGVAIDPASTTLFIASRDDRRVRIVSLGGGAAPTPTFTATSIPPTATPPSQATATRTPTKTNTATSQAVISGAITYYSNSQLVPGVSVNLTGPSNVTVQTNGQANYSATVPQATWSVEPSKTGAFGTAVSSLDAARVLQALAGLQHFTNQQRLACDATGDGTLSTLDAVYILQFSAGLIDHLPAAAMCGSDWIFYPSPNSAQNQQIIYPVLSGTCQQGAILYNPLAGSASGQDFDGILLGDCTGNWTAGAALRQRAGSTTVLAAAARKRAHGRFIVPIYVKTTSPFQALDLRLQYDSAATFVGATARGAAANAMTSVQATDGRLSVSLASAQEIDDRHGAIVLLEFRGAAPSVTLDGALVDEQPARVASRTRAH